MYVTCCTNCVVDNSFSNDKRFVKVAESQNLNTGLFVIKIFQTNRAFCFNFVNYLVIVLYIIKSQYYYFSISSLVMPAVRLSTFEWNTFENSFLGWNLTSELHQRIHQILRFACLSKFPFRICLIRNSESSSMNCQFNHAIVLDNNRHLRLRPLLCLPSYITQRLHMCFLGNLSFYNSNRS